MLRRVATEHDVAFIVDEVQTGVGATGKYWAHQHWDVQPDMMTFAKKMQASGIYTTDKYKPSYAYQHFNTWYGDPIRLLIAREQNKIIE
jgi:4-aminobutyrate aminotransferase/(S)-3-amino-2-methylpropionate transaminase